MLKISRLTVAPSGICILYQVENKTHRMFYPHGSFKVESYDSEEGETINEVSLISYRDPKFININHINLAIVLMYYKYDRVIDVIQ